MSLRLMSAVALLALSSCGGGAEPTAKPGAAGGGAVEPAPAPEGRRDTLVIGYQSDIGQLIGLVSEAAADTAILTNLSTPVVDSDFDCSLKKLPGVATSWEWSEDGKILSMTLRDDLKWQDGHPVTAEDLAFTYELIADPTVASPRIAYIERMAEGGRPKIIDPTHIEWHFTEAYDRDTQMAHVSAVPIVPKHLLKDADRATLRGHDLSKNPMSYGPFKLAKWEPNQRIVLEPNDAYAWTERLPKLNRVIFRIIPEYQTRLIELEAGKIDLMEAILIQDADKLRKEHPEINLVRRGWRSNDYIGWNTKNPLFADVKVRRALAHAVNIQSMIDKLLTSDTGEVFAKPSIGTITPALCGVHNDDVQPLNYETEKAKALLAEAGWTDSDGDGILDKDGKKFSFSLSTNTGNSRRAQIQVMMQSMFKDVGIEVNLETLESNKFFDNLRKKDFDAAVAGWSAGLFVDPTVIWHCDTDEKKYEFNFVSYCNPEVDALMEKGLQTPNPRDAAPIWKEVQAKIYEDQPYLFLWWMDEIVGIHSRFTHEEIDILSALHNLHAWEVDPAQVKYKR